MMDNPKIPLKLPSPAMGSLARKCGHCGEEHDLLFEETARQGFDTYACPHCGEALYLTGGNVLNATKLP